MTCSTRCNVSIEPGGETAGREAGADHAAVLGQRGGEDPLDNALNQGARQRMAVPRRVSAPFVGQVHGGEGDHRAGERRATAQIPADRPEVVDQRAASSDGAHRSSSNTDVEPARPTTPSSGASSDMRPPYETVRR
jgi:hypothetical protein